MCKKINRGKIGGVIYEWTIGKCANLYICRSFCTKVFFVQYVYGKDKKEKNVLEGAKVISFDGQKAYVQEIYVGLEFTLEDILENKINRNAIGVKNLDVFKSKYEKLGATGVIYFPEIDKYEFLEAGDIVIPWVSHENVEKSLEEALKPYRKLATDKVVKQRVVAKKAYVESLDPEDALVELSGLSLQRQVSSR